MVFAVKVMVTIGSLASTGFGIWHFFVPKIWNWYSYIDHQATELIVAVRAINVFFSLSLVLFSALNLFFVWSGKANRYSVIVLMSATSILWLTRVLLQFAYPQGSINPFLQYGMLASFGFVTLCYLISLCLLLSQKVIAGDAI